MRSFLFKITRDAKPLFNPLAAAIAFVVVVVFLFEEHFTTFLSFSYQSASYTGIRFFLRGSFRVLRGSFRRRKGIWAYPRPILDPLRSL